MNITPLKGKDQNSRFFILLLVALALIYSNSLDGSWHFDDILNIVENPNIHMNNFHWDDIKKTFHASYDNGHYSSDTLYRPVAGFTFGINWFFCGSTVSGYHYVNLALHFITSFLLYLTLLLLLKSVPNSEPENDSKNRFVVALAVFLWAMHPIQVQAVTYIVQRMALLSALFYLAGIYFYLKAWFARRRYAKVICHLFVGICFLLAVGSKENAIMMPVSLLIIHLLFLDRRLILKKKNPFTVIMSLGSLLIIGLVLSILLSRMDFIVKGFETRSFTLSQRVLTEPRVVLFHITQLFYPVASRFSILHDMAPSLSLFSPWQTFPAFLLIMAIPVLGILSSGKHPFISLAILFFLVNHLVEGSIIPLEILFEHRNYLPSMFLFVPISAGAYHLIFYYKTKNKPMALFIVLSIIVFLGNIGYATYIRNFAWKTEETLWRDAMEKAPSWARPYQNYSTTLDSNRDPNADDRSFKLNKKALDLKSSTPVESRFTSNINMGNAKLNLKEYDKAEIYLKNAIALKPTDREARYYLAKVYALQGDYQLALTSMDTITNKGHTDPTHLSFKGFLLMKNGFYNEAEALCRDILLTKPDHLAALLITGSALKMQHRYKKAETYFKKAYNRSGNSMLPLLYLIEIYHQLEDKKRVRLYTTKLVNNFPLKGTLELMESIQKENSLIYPIAKGIINEQLIDILKKKRDAFSGTNQQHDTNTIPSD